MLISTTANAFALKLDDTIKLSGYVEYQGRHITRERQDKNILNSTTLRLNAATFLWQPWLALLDGGVGFTYSNSQNGYNLTGEDVTGNANFRLFPRSRFPFNAYFDRRRSVIDGDVPGPDITRTSYGLDQTYTTSGGSRYFVRYQRIISADETGDESLRLQSEDVDDTLNLNVTTQLGEHLLDLAGNYDKVDREKNQEKNVRISQLLRHQYRPDASLSINNFESFNNTEQSRINSEINYRLLQINSNVFWRPDTQKPLQLTGTSLLQAQDRGNGDESRELYSGRLSLQANYQWSPYLNLRAATSLAATENGSDNTVTSLQRAGVDFSPAEKAILGMQYAYTLSADAANRTGEDEGNSQELTINIGHVFSRSLPVLDGILNFSASQRGATLLANNAGTGFDRIITHTATAGWTRATNNVSTFIRISASDTRRFDDEENGLQLFNFQVSQNHQLTRESFWNGSVTLQVSNPVGGREEEQDRVDFYTSVDLSYTHQRLFRINRLNYVSQLHYLSNSLLNAVRSEGLDIEESDDSYWQNRIEYYIGRIQLRLLGDVGVTNGDINTLVFFQIRRNFGN